MKYISWSISLVAGMLGWYLNVFWEGLLFVMMGWVAAIFYAASDVENFYETITGEDLE